MDIDCGGVLDISVVAQWWQQALTALKSGDPISIKAEDIQRVDAAGIQAILSLFKSAKQRDISIQIHNPSPALYEAAKLTGLNKELMLS